MILNSLLIKFQYDTGFLSFPSEVPKFGTRGLVCDRLNTLPLGPYAKPRILLLFHNLPLDLIISSKLLLNEASTS